MKRKSSIALFGIQFFLWIILTFFLLYLIYDQKAPFLQQFIATLTVTGFTAVPAYISSKVFVPRLLYRKFIGKFISALLLIALGNTVLVYFLGGAFYYELSGKSIFRSIAVIQVVSLSFYIINCIVIVVSCAIQIIIDRFRMERYLHEVENEKVTTELAFLRAQINPHFLYNTLDMINWMAQRNMNTEIRIIPAY